MELSENVAYIYSAPLYRGLIENMGLSGNVVAKESTEGLSEKGACLQRKVQGGGAEAGEASEFF